MHALRVLPCGTNSCLCFILCKLQYLCNVLVGQKASPNVGRSGGGVEGFKEGLRKRGFWQKPRPTPIHHNIKHFKDISGDTKASVLSLLVQAASSLSLPSRVGSFELVEGPSIGASPRLSGCQRRLTSTHKDDWWSSSRFYFHHLRIYSHLQCAKEKV